MKRRLLASILSLVMVLSLLPTAAWAADGEETDLSDPPTSGSDGESATLGPNIYPTAQDGFQNKNGANTFEFNDEWLRLSSLKNENVDDNENGVTSYLNFWTKPFAGISVGDRYWLTYEVKNVSVKDGEDEAASTGLMITSSPDSQFDTGATLTIKDGETYSGSTVITATMATGDSNLAGGGLRSFATVPYGYTVGFDIKITLQKMPADDNLYPYAFVYPGAGVSVNKDMKVSLDCNDQEQYHNFFAAKGDIKAGEYYKVSYTMDVESAEGNPIVFISSGGNSGNLSQLGNQNVLLMPTEAGTISGEFIAMGQTEGVANMLRSFVQTDKGSSLKATVAIRVEEIDSYAIAVGDAITAARLDNPESNKAPAGQVVRYRVEANGNVVLKVTDNSNDPVSFTYANSELSFTMPASAVTISATVFQLSATVNGQTIRPQSVNGQMYLFLPASADFNSVMLSGNAILTGTNETTSVDLSRANGATSVNLTSLFTEKMQAGVAYDLKINNGPTVKVMKASNISTLFITSDKNVNELNASKENAGEGTAVMVGNDGNQINSDIALKKIKGRGNTSWYNSGDKRPYNITLEKKAELISGAGAAKKWCLISDNCGGNWVHEAAGLANAAAYDMYEAIGGKNAMANEFINLYINGEYRGVYLLTEKVEINKERVNIAESEYETEDEVNTTLIMKKDGVDPHPQYWSTTLANKANVPEENDPAIAAGIQAYQYATGSALRETSGGFLLELDRGFNSEASWFITKRGYPYVLKEPEFATKEQVQMIAAYVQAAEDAAFADSGYNAEGKYYTDYYDLDSLTKKIMIDLVSYQCDTFVTSCFFSVNVENGQLGKIYAGPAWDYDGANFAAAAPVPDNRAETTGSGAVHTPHMVYEFYQHADFVAAMKELSDGEMKTAWESEKGKVETYVEQLAASYAMNAILWPQGNSGATNATTDPNAIDTFKINFNNRYDVWYRQYTDETKMYGVTVSDGKSVNLLEATVTGAVETYQWAKLNEVTKELEIIDGAAEATFAPTENGTYYCIIGGSMTNWVSGGEDTKLYSAPCPFELKPFNVTFDKNAEDATLSTTNKEVTYNTLYGELPTPVRTGYKFVGWFTAADVGTQVKAEDTVATTQPYTLYAHWTRKAVPTLTITADKETMTGSGNVTLTVSAPENAGDITVSYKAASSDTVTTLTPNANGKYVVNLPNRTELYTFTMTCAESEEYAYNSATCTVSVTRYVHSAPGSSVSVPATANGSVTVSPSTASKGTTVTVTTKPNEGYELGSLEVLDKNGNALVLKDLGSGKYSFTMPDGKVTVNASFVKASASTGFADVPANAYFADAVKWAVDKGVTNGLSDTMFGPYESCTRAQIVTFLWRAAGSPEPKTASSFTDVPVSTYYAKAVAWAVENGITNGMTETAFAPNATCTRGQSVTFLYRALKGIASGSANFTDVASDAFYADAISWAVANNVTNGTSNTTFSPNADCTRAEIVTFLYRAYQGK